jgi:triosephosphate isomerase
MSIKHTRFLFGMVPFTLALIIFVAFIVIGVQSLTARSAHADTHTSALAGTRCDYGAFTGHVDPLHGIDTGCIQKQIRYVTGGSEYRTYTYQPSMCLLPTDEGMYQESSPILCVNTGLPATHDQIKAGYLADQCVTGGYVACWSTDS